LINLLTNKISAALLIAIAILASYIVILGDYSGGMYVKLVLLLVEGLMLDYFCYKHSILGRKTHLPLVIFIILCVIIVPHIAFGDLIYGTVWLGAFFLAFEGREKPEQSANYIILFGILLGISQAISNISILLIIPVFILFIQSGTRGVRGFFLSLLYFGMVVVAYIGILYVMELSPQIQQMVPSLQFDYSVFNTIVIKLFVPYLVLSIIVHFLRLNSYSFRYPNQSKILNLTLLMQAVLAVILILLTAELDMIMYAIMSLTVLLSFSFEYSKTMVFANAAFASLLTIAFMSIYLYKILIL
jgi:hypothetical protein